ncbi:MAG TPA: hypothetical protein VGX28_03040 [Frankiaceae bacterium]|jgi:hypothetical protein|nr:hypothetical protein [Frankiaceae bacterium]
MILACDNCVIADTSRWYMSLALGVLVAVALAMGCVRLAARRDGRRSVAACVAAGALVVGPFGAVLALYVDPGTGNLTCGSALSSALLRGLPNDAALTEDQAYCKEHGETLVRGAVAAAATSVVAAALLAGWSWAPPPRRAALA